MAIRFLGEKLSSFQIIIFGFLGLILIELKGKPPSEMGEEAKP